MVITRPWHIIGKAILSRKPVGVIMVIDIIGAIAKIFHHFCRGIQNMRRWRQRPGLRGCGGGLLKTPIGRIRFWRGRQINHQTGDGQIPLGTAKAFIGLPCGQCPRHRLGFGKPDIFGRKPGQTPQNIMRILATGQHPAQPIQPGIRIRGAQRLMQRRHQIIMLIPGLIKSWRPRRNNLRQCRCIKLRLRRPIDQQRRHIEQITPISIRHGA